MSKRTAAKVKPGDFRVNLCDLAGTREIRTAELCRRMAPRLGVSEHQLVRYIKGETPIPLTLYLLVRCLAGYREG